MAKYDTRRRTSTAAPRRAGRIFLRQCGLMSLSFAAGYLCASFYDYEKLSAWVNTHVLSVAPTVIAGKPVAQVAEIPKPKFEFYTLLTKDSRTGVMVETAPVVNANAPVVAIAPQAPVVAPPMDLTVTSPIAEAAGKVALPVPLVAQAIAQTRTPVMNKDAYLVQLASFRTRPDAERMKASLIMKGFDASVAAVTQQNVSWYRVVIGPYASRVDAQRAQGVLARRERIMGMIRKMDA